MLWLAARHETGLLFNVSHPNESFVRPDICAVRSTLLDGFLWRPTPGSDPQMPRNTLLILALERGESMAGSLSAQRWASRF